MISSAARSLRASMISDAPLATPWRCVVCAHKTTQQRTRRLQSTASASSNREEPFKPMSQSEASSQQTHYSFFPKSLSSGPPPHAPFAIDLQALKREFLQLQARAHPDLHPPADKKRAEALSARINDAYKTLQSPLLRAQYLLSMRGIEIAEDETAKVEDPDLLIEVLEAREEIEDADKEADLQHMKARNEDRIAESTAVLEKAFQDDDLTLAKSEAVKLRYWVNIKESIEAWEPGKPVVLQH